jgi:hypothetical protein
MHFLQVQGKCSRGYIQAYEAMNRNSFSQNNCIFRFSKYRYDLLCLRVVAHKINILHYAYTVNYVLQKTVFL